MIYDRFFLGFDWVKHPLQDVFLVSPDQTRNAASRTRRIHSTKAVSSFPAYFAGAARRWYGKTARFGGQAKAEVGGQKSEIKDQRSGGKGHQFFIDDRGELCRMASRSECACLFAACSLGSVVLCALVLSFCWWLSK